MQRLTITIPTHDNIGRPFSWELWRLIERRLLRLYGGFTRVTVSGLWTNVDSDGVCRTYQDESTRYEILTDREYDKLTYFAGALCRRLGQYSILTTCEDVPTVDFISPTDATCGLW